MELPINENPEFTEWLVREGVLVEPFVLIDVGVQDGEDGRWRVLGDHLVVHGFDPIAEVVEALSTLNHGKVHRHYNGPRQHGWRGELLLQPRQANRELNVPACIA